MRQLELFGLETEPQPFVMEQPENAVELPHAATPLVFSDNKIGVKIKLKSDNRESVVFTEAQPAFKEAASPLPVFRGQEVKSTSTAVAAGNPPLSNEPLPIKEFVNLEIPFFADEPVPSSQQQEEEMISEEDVTKEGTASAAISVTDAPAYTLRRPMLLRPAVITIEEEVVEQPALPVVQEQAPIEEEIVPHTAEEVVAEIAAPPMPELPFFEVEEAPVVNAVETDLQEQLPPRPAVITEAKIVLAPVSEEKKQSAYRPLLVRPAIITIEEEEPVENEATAAIEQQEDISAVAESVITDPVSTENLLAADSIEELAAVIEQAAEAEEEEVEAYEEEVYEYLSEEIADDEDASLEEAAYESADDAEEEWEEEESEEYSEYEEEVYEAEDDVEEAGEETAEQVEDDEEVQAEYAGEADALAENTGEVHEVVVEITEESIGETQSEVAEEPVETPLVEEADDQEYLIEEVSIAEEEAADVEESFAAELIETSEELTESNEEDEKVVVEEAAAITATLEEEPVEEVEEETEYEEAVQGTYKERLNEEEESEEIYEPEEVIEEEYEEAEAIADAEEEVYEEETKELEPAEELEDNEATDVATVAVLAEESEDELEATEEIYEPENEIEEEYEEAEAIAYSEEEVYEEETEELEPAEELDEEEIEEVEGKIYEEENVEAEAEIEQDASIEEEEIETIVATIEEANEEFIPKESIITGDNNELSQPEIVDEEPAFDRDVVAEMIDAESEVAPIAAIGAEAEITEKEQAGIYAEQSLFNTIQNEQEEDVEIEEDEIYTVRNSGDKPLKRDAPGKQKRGRKSLREIDAEVDLLHVPDDDVLFEKQYYPISVVAGWFNVNPSLLRFWENEFTILKPRKNRKGDRLFRPEDVKNLQVIYYLLRQRKFTIEGAKEYLKTNKKKADTNTQLVHSLNKVRNFLLEFKASLLV